MVFRPGKQKRVLKPEQLKAISVAVCGARNQKEFAAKMGMSYGHFRTLLHSRSPINKKHAEKALTLVRYQSAVLFKLGNKLEEIIRLSDSSDRLS